MRPNHLLRRDFLAVTGATVGAMALWPRSLRAQERTQEQVASILKNTINVDMHNHVYPAGTEPKRQWDGPRLGGQGGPRRQVTTVGNSLARSAISAVE